MTGGVSFRGRRLTALALLWVGVLMAEPMSMDAQTLTVASVGGSQGTSVWWDVALDAQNKSIAGTQSDISFDSTNTPVAKNTDGTPVCVVNDELANQFSAVFLPDGCTGTACDRIRVIVSPTNDRAALPDNVVLFRCRSDIAATAPQGSYFLAISAIHTSDPLSSPVPATGVHGLITVGAGCS